MGEDRPEGVETEGRRTRPRRARTRAGAESGSGRGNGGARRRRNSLSGVTPYTPEDLLEALRDLEAGEFDARLPETGDEIAVEIARTFNRVTARKQELHAELLRVSRTLGRDGVATDRLELPGLTGGWAGMVDALNSLIADLVQPTQELARTLSAVAQRT
jgi:hypothetical protein